jgi:hypothetical protein
MSEGKDKKTETGEWLALHFPGVPKSWLRRVSEKLALLIKENGGNAEMHVRFSRGRVQWTDWSQRDLFPSEDNN